MSKRVRGAEDFLKRRKLIRLKFQKYVRLVIYNRMWLTEIEEEKFSLNYRKNISSIIHNEQKVGILTLGERTLLRKVHEFRSIQDRKTLVKLVAGLRCFAQIPPKVRARLVPVIKFLLLGPGRLILRENDYPPIFVYYIISGEVEVTKRYFDKFTNTYINKHMFLYRAGDCIGDTEMLENIPRRFDYKSTTDVELLVVIDDDFDRILRPTCAMHWENRRIAVKSLDYFNHFTKEQITTACKFGHIKQFHPLETIYFEDKGSQSFVYFILSGECIILQCLKMKVKMKGNTKSFELVSLGDGVTSNIRKRSLAQRMMVHDEHLDSLGKNLLQKHIDKLETTSENEKTMIKKLNMERNLREMEAECENKKRILLEIGVEEYNKRMSREIEVKNKEPKFRKTGEGKVQSSSRTQFASSQVTFDLKSVDKLTNPEETIIEEEVENEEENKEEDGEAEEEEGNEEEEQSTTSASSFDSLSEVVSRSESDESIVEQNKDIENRFFDVGSLTYGGIFGLGEKYEHRVVMARTTVQCLVLPRFWLFEKEQNPGNMWQKKRFQINNSIPSRQQIFTNFLKTRRWLKFREKFVQSNLDHDLNSNPTKTQDIPIICRITEPHDE